MTLHVAVLSGYQDLFAPKSASELALSQGIFEDL